MAITIEALRQMVELDPNDPMMRYALGRKLFEEDPSPEGRTEAAGHLRFVRDHDRNNIAGWHTLAQLLVELGEEDEARRTLRDGIARIDAEASIDGTDLRPAMEALLESLE